MTFEILIGADDFWQSLKTDMLGAQDKVCIQAMTFEADSIGHDLFNTLKASPAKDKSLCVDNFSKLTISDSFVYGLRRFKDAKFKTEIRDTQHIFKTAHTHNIGMFFTNPLGFLWAKYPARNHKKLMLIDDNICYIGGVNFSEHNFAWHDMMLRIDDKGIANFFHKDFQTTIGGKNQSLKTTISGTDIFVLNGYRSEGLYEELFDIIRAAKTSIKVISPYITAPFLDVIGEQALNGLDVSIISPRTNNKNLLKYYIQYQHHKYPFSILMYEKKMSHLKAMLIDNEVLIMGSTNFDFLSYYFEQEYCLVLRDKKIVENFKKNILNPAITQSTNYAPKKPSFKQKLANEFVKNISVVCKTLAPLITPPR